MRDTGCWILEWTTPMASDSEYLKNQLISLLVTANRVNITDVLTELLQSQFCYDKKTLTDISFAMVYVSFIRPGTVILLSCKNNYGWCYAW